MEKYYSHIDWVDDYVKNVAPYIYVREEDHLLIKIPNEAYKLNTIGVSILKRMLKGERARDIVNAYPDRERVAGDIHVFFSDLRALLKGCYHEMDERRAVVKVPFTLGFNTPGLERDRGYLPMQPGLPVLLRGMRVQEG